MDDIEPAFQAKVPRAMGLSLLPGGVFFIISLALSLRV